MRDVIPRTAHLRSRHHPSSGELLPYPVRTTASIAGIRAVIQSPHRCASIDKQLPFNPPSSLPPIKDKVVKLTAHSSTAPCATSAASSTSALQACKWPRKT